MYGYLAAGRELLSEEEQGRYRALYCGLCRSLQERHGELSRLTLNYDMTFLVLLLSSLYEPEEQEKTEACIVHPFKPRRWQRNENSDYAADMNVMLAYIKCRDDWDDDVDPAAKLKATLLSKAYKSVLPKYQRQCSVTQEALSALGDIERSGAEEPDAAAQCFGRLMGEIFVMREDHWSEPLRTMGMALGKFIYVMDACMDLEDDKRYCRYNPFISRAGKKDNGEYFGALLKMLLGDCVKAFDRLPLVQDVSIMKNILCFGLWIEFNKKYGERKETTDVSGSV